MTWSGHSVHPWQHVKMLLPMYGHDLVDLSLSLRPLILVAQYRAICCRAETAVRGAVASLQAPTLQECIPLLNAPLHRTCMAYLPARGKQRLPLAQHSGKIKGLQCDVDAVLQVLQLRLLLSICLLCTCSSKVLHTVVWKGLRQQTDCCSSSNAGVPIHTVQEAMHLQQAAEQQHHRDIAAVDTQVNP